MPAAKVMRKKKDGAAKKPAPKAAQKVTLDDVWAAMRELQEMNKEIQKSHQETEQAIRETQRAHQEMNKEIQKAHQETEKAIKETQRNINGLSNTFGSLVEHIMTPGLPRKFKKFGFAFDKISRVRWAEEGSVYAEIDGLLENGEQAMVVEVKATLRHDDVDEHAKRMEKIRKYADGHGDKRKYLGAMAAMITGESARKYALKNGFYVIEPLGEDIKITKPAAEKVW